jgi:V-type H+-transporting ATPase subunit a
MLFFFLYENTQGSAFQAEVAQTEGRVSLDDSSAPLLQNDDQEGQYPGNSVSFDLEFVAGTIERTRMATFERVLWRVLRGNLYMNHTQIEEPFVDPNTLDEVRKDVFIVFGHGEALLAKIRKVAESMGATLYPIDSNADKRSDALRDVSGRLEDLQTVLYNTGLSRRAALVNIGESLASWQDVVRKEKMIYETLNLFNYDARRKTLIAEGWCPTRDITTIQLALRHATVCLCSSHLCTGPNSIKGGVWYERSADSARAAHAQDSTNISENQQVH